MKKTIIVKWRIKESQTPRILNRLAELAQRTRSEKGNVSYEIYQSETDPNELILHECSVDGDAAEAHRNSEHYRTIVVDEILPHLEVREVTPVRKLV
jgi:quinol monooxygenase YgiN